MSLTNRLWIALLAISGASLERAFWYFVLAGFAWVTLHVILARWLARRRIASQPLPAGQMGREMLHSLCSLAVYGLVGGFMVFAVVSQWTTMYFRISYYGWPWFLVSIGVIILIHDAYFCWT